MTICFFPSSDLETLYPHHTYTQKSLIIARNALKLLMMGWQGDWTQMLSARVLYAVFIKRDKALLKGMRVAFQEGFQHVFNTNLASQSITPDSPEWNQVQFFLSNCLSLLPYSDISPEDTFQIPQWVDNQWQLVHYKVVPIELTPRQGWRSLRFYLYPNDRVYAYGLEPQNNTKATPHLIFMGTTYPAGQGFTSQLQTDLDGLGTPGADLYRTGHELIVNWMNNQKNLIHVCGTSLGGALSLLLVRDHKDKISRVDALNPPGLSVEPQAQWNGPEVYIQKQNNDPVSFFGYWMPGWRMFHVVPPQSQRNNSSMLDHALNYAGLEGTEFFEISPDEDNQSRNFRNFYIYFLLRTVVNYLFVLPYIYLIRPIVKLVFDLTVFLFEKLYECFCPEPDKQTALSL